MTMWYYRLAVIGCALSWFMVGLHLPVLHEMTHHGQAPAWSALAMTLLLAIAGAGAVWALLRAPARWSKRSDSGAPAT